ncbi:USP6 N-terminal-like protein isoform X2 [Canis lupus familiaris]|uniref:USP6 N-terminal-like protein isoform X2 n=1 Tax=Canis lupus familiaris TaxID=9615 RepID=UPI0018F59496|nr:USP6 N-terminal-like protein isoform X2 [Canis lupus familiaris]
MCPRNVLTRRHSWMCLDCSTMQEDPETLLALQRANIVAQYHQAHQAGSPQDLSLCKVTDHQGFLQDKELSGPSPCEAKKLRQETQRVDKWIKMLKRWDHYLPSEKEMKEAALVSSRDIMQIDLDVNRTFRSHTMFWDRYRVGQGALFHIAGGLLGERHGGGLLPGHERDCGHPPHVPARGGRLLGAGLADDQRQACHARLFRPRLPEAPQVPGSS